MKMTHEGSSGSGVVAVASKVERSVDESSANLLSSTGCFENLPVELIEKILGKLDEMADRVKFGAVCKQWRSALRSPIVPRVGLPWLLLRPLDDKILKFCSISTTTSKTYSIHHNLVQYVLKYRTLGTSDSGWLLLFNFKPTDPSRCPLLFNPITGSQILLPMLPHSFTSCARTTIVSAQDKSLVVMTTLNIGCLLCCRIIKSAEKPSEWTMISLGDLVGAHHGGTCMFTYHQDLYIVLPLTKGSTYIINPLTNKLVFIMPEIPIFPLELRRRHGWSRHLVPSTSGEELFLVITPSLDLSKTFEVFRWDSTEQQYRWSKVTSIGSDVFFKSDYDVMAFPAVNNLSTSIRANCIVFMESACLYLYDIRNDNVEKLSCPWDLQKGTRTLHWFLPCSVRNAWMDDLS